MNFSRATLGGLAVALVAGGLAFATAAPVSATQPDESGEHKVWVCHATSGLGELKNGYNLIHVDVASTVPGGGAHGENDHYGHSTTGPKHNSRFGELLDYILGETLPAELPGKCGAPPQEDDEATATATYTPPTCTAPGSVSKSSGSGYTWSESGTDLAKTYTATADEGYVLTGTTVYGPWRILQLTVFDTLSCRPAQPADDVVTVDSGDPTCGSTTVATTTTTTPFVWDALGGVWIKGTSSALNGTRPLTNMERAKLGPNCVKDDEITYGDWTGQYECGDETVAETRTKTVVHFTYDLESGQFTAGSPDVTTENRDRPASDEERGDDTCRPEKAPLSITEDIGEPECGSDTVDTRTTTKTYSYTFEDGEWVESSVQQLELGTRPLTEKEQDKLAKKCVVPAGQNVTPAGPELTSSATTSTGPAQSSAALPAIQPSQAPVAPTSAAPTIVTSPASGSLPVTGGSPWTTLWIALAALGAGGLVVRFSRRSTS